MNAPHPYAGAGTLRHAMRLARGPLSVSEAPRDARTWLRRGSRRQPAASAARVRHGLLVACCLLLAAYLGAVQTDARAQGVWELTPYRILLVVACDRSAFTPAVERDLAASLIERADQWVGAAWQVEPHLPSAPLRWRLAAGLDGMAIADLPERRNDYDKLLMVYAGSEPNGFRLEVREWDSRTQFWGVPQRVRFAQPALLESLAFDALVTAFAPLARLEKAERSEAVLRLRAAALTPREPALRFVVPGDLLRAAVRHNDREGKLVEVRPVDWTYLVVEEIDGSALTCHVHSALRSPLSGRRRGRIEPLALLIRPTGASTRLSLVTKDNPPRPLAGYDLYAYAHGQPTTTALGRTDRQGSVLVPPADHPLRLLLVKHGGELLAKLPMVPGLEPELTAILAPDDARLAVEGFITGMQEDLVDLVARRKVLLAQALNALDSGQLEPAQTALDALRRLRSQQQFARRLDQAQREMIASDPRTQARIDKLFADTRKLVNQFLDPREVAEVEQRVRAAGSRAAATTVASPPEG